MQNYRTSIQSYISENYPAATINDIIGKKQIVVREYPYLLGTLPYKNAIRGAHFSDLPDNLRHKITFSLNAGDTFETLPTNLTRSLPELAGKRISLNYLPATEKDAEVIAMYGYYSSPPYLVKLKPVIFIEGVQAWTGSIVDMGVYQSLEVAFNSPNMSDDVVSHPLVASALVSIGLDMQKITPDQLGKRKDMLEAAANKIGKEEVPYDDLIGEILNIHALTYFMSNDLFTQSLAGREIAYVKLPAEMAVMINPVVKYFYGVPSSMRSPSMQLDVKRNVMARKSFNGDTLREIGFTLGAGFLSSAMEHGLFDLLEPKGKSISTVKILALANESGIPIYRINAENSATVLQRLIVSPDTAENIRNAVAAGKEVIVPERSIQYYQWAGDGYVVFDPNTGAADYLISGGLFGGSEACDSVAINWNYENFVTLSGGVGEYCENHAVPIVKMLNGVKTQLLRWAAGPMWDAEIAAASRLSVAALTLPVFAMIKVFQNLDDIKSHQNRILLFTFTLCLSFLAVMLIAQTAKAGPKWGVVGAIAVNILAIQFLDWYTQMLIVMESQTSFIRRRKLIYPFDWMNV